MNFLYTTSCKREGRGIAMRLSGPESRSLKTLFLAVRITVLLIITACLQVSAKTTTAQRVSISLHNGSLEKLFSEIEKKTNYVFFYDVAILKNTRPVTVEVKDASVEEVLQTSLKGQSLEYEIKDRTIFLKKDKSSGNTIGKVSIGNPPGVTGVVRSENGTLLAGASVYIKKLKKSQITNALGEFNVKDVPNGKYEVEISYVGYEKYLTTINVEEQKATVVAEMKLASNKLDEMVVIPYGTTTQRLNTGDVTKITAKEIEQQPVTNVLAALEGRVPGLVISQQTGLPGGAFSVLIRGQSSITNGSEPFYVIDGVPYSSEIPNAIGHGVINGALRGGNPLNFLNPYDIESVEILKDADATSIYGSRAANGAILITTKKGKEGTFRVDLNFNSGFTSPARNIKLLNTQQYLAVRHEAFNNDGASPGTSDYDINGVWDTTRYTDWSKTLLNSHPIYTNANVSVSGGNTSTQWLIGAGYNKQTSGIPTLISGDGAEQKGSVHFNLNSISANKKFRLTLISSYVSDKNTIQKVDLSSDRVILSPDAPPLFNDDGSLNWAPKNIGEQGTWNNPLAGLYNKYRGTTNSMVSNAIAGYTILPGLELKTSVGYTNTQMDEILASPTTIFDPARQITSGSSNFNTSNDQSWIVEPQVSYKVELGGGILTALLGETFHENKTNAQFTGAEGYVSDALLEDIQAASTIHAQSNKSQYKYNAFFGRVNYNWRDKYLMNITARRDGSSRFGPGKQFGNFGAIGGAWIFSKEEFIQGLLPFLSFGKIRGSYGTTGNDQIGDYRFLDLYATTNYPYQGTQGLYPQSLFNPELAWEIDKKLEVGLELGIWKDRIIIQANIYRNRSGNQLVSSPVSDVAGFNNIPANLPAKIQNSGQEFVFRTINIKTKSFTWTSSLNLSVSRSKLLAFPNLATSVYSQSYKIGEPTTSLPLFHMIGVNDTTGVYEFADFKGNKTYNPNYSTDLISRVNTTPKFYGGLQNNLTYKGFSIDFLFQFVKQTGENIIGLYSALPGTMSNLPEAFLDRWQKPGDKKKYQRFSQDYGSNATNALGSMLNSDFMFSDASFIRLKNLAVSWQIPTKWIHAARLQNGRIYVQGQNLATITKYNGLDPETQSLSSPPKRVWTAGFQVSF
jgi:TonB-linked SusC/RagA family outer membrane protein